MNCRWLELYYHPKLITDKHILRYGLRLSASFVYSCKNESADYIVDRNGNKEAAIAQERVHNEPTNKGGEGLAACCRQITQSHKAPGFAERNQVGSKSPVYCPKDAPAYSNK